MKAVIKICPHYEFCEMRILTTGGAGYIGSHTCLELLQEGYDVVVVDNLSNGKEESLKRVQRITGRSLFFDKVDL
jgi:UDP-glucose 4-epimerase